MKKIKKIMYLKSEFLILNMKMFFRNCKIAVHIQKVVMIPYTSDYMKKHEEKFYSWRHIICHLSSEKNTDDCDWTALNY